VRPSPREFAEFNGLLATVVDRGLPLAPAFGLLAGIVRSRGLGDALRGVGRGLEEGMSLPDAMGRYPAVFPADYCGLVRAGSESGRLSDVLRTAQTHHNLRAQLRAKLFRVFLYVVCGLILGELALGSVALVNELARDINQQTMRALELREGPELTPHSMLQFVALLMVALPIGFGFVALGYFVLQRWERAGWIGYLIPAWGSIQKSRDLALFCSAVGMRLRAGVPMIEALEDGRKAVVNRRFRYQAGRLIQRVRDGESLSSALFYLRFFPKTMSWGVSLAEENGEVPRALDTFAGLYTTQMERGFELLHELMTPLGVVTIGNVVFLAALALVSPFLTVLKVYQSF